MNSLVDQINSQNQKMTNKDSNNNSITSDKVIKSITKDLNNYFESKGIKAETHNNAQNTNDESSKTVDVDWISINDGTSFKNKKEISEDGPRPKINTNNAVRSIQAQETSSSKNTLEQHQKHGLPPSSSLERKMSNFNNIKNDMQQKQKHEIASSDESRAKKTKYTMLLQPDNSESATLLPPVDNGRDGDDYFMKTTQLLPSDHVFNDHDKMLKITKDPNFKPVLKIASSTSNHQSRQAPPLKNDQQSQLEDLYSELATLLPSSLANENILRRILLDSGLSKNMANKIIDENPEIFSNYNKPSASSRKVQLDAVTVENQIKKQEDPMTSKAKDNIKDEQSINLNSKDFQEKNNDKTYQTNYRTNNARDVGLFEIESKTRTLRPIKSVDKSNTGSNSHKLLTFEDGNLLSNINPVNTEIELDKSWPSSWIDSLTNIDSWSNENTVAFIVLIIIILIVICIPIFLIQLITSYLKKRKQESELEDLENQHNNSSNNKQAGKNKNNILDYKKEKSANDIFRNSSSLSTGKLISLSSQNSCHSKTNPSSFLKDENNCRIPGQRSGRPSIDTTRTTCTTLAPLPISISGSLNRNHSCNTSDLIEQQQSLQRCQDSIDKNALLTLDAEHLQIIAAKLAEQQQQQQQLNLIQHHTKAVVSAQCSIGTIDQTLTGYNKPRPYTMPVKLSDPENNGAELTQNQDLERPEKQKVAKTQSAKPTTGHHQSLANLNFYHMAKPKPVLENKFSIDSRNTLLNQNLRADSMFHDTGSFTKSRTQNLSLQNKKTMRNSGYNNGLPNQLSALDSSESGRPGRYDDRKGRRSHKVRSTRVADQVAYDDSFLAKQKRQPEPAQEARMVRNLSKSVGDLSLDFSLEESKTQKAASRREGSKNGRRSKKEQGQVSLYYDNLGNLQVKTAH